MNDPAVALAIATVLESLSALAGCSVCAHFERLVAGQVQPPAPEIDLPAVLVESKSQALAGSQTFATATVEIIVESQVDDDPASVHNARCQAVLAAMADQSALVTAFAAKGITLRGRPAAVENNPEIETRASKAVMTYKVGYAS